MSFSIHQSKYAKVLFLSAVCLLPFFFALGFNLPTSGQADPSSPPTSTSVAEGIAEQGQVDESGQIQPDIWGGREADVKDWPWQVALVSGAEPSSDYYAKRFCGGSLIATDLVLTAAHCVITNSLGFVSELPINSYSVVAGVTNLSNPGSGAQHRNVSKAYIHQSYFENSELDDIALLVLDNPLPSADARIGTIALARNNVESYVGQYGTATGWGGAGNYDNGKVVWPPNLLRGDQMIRSREECSELYSSRNYTRLNGQEFCAGNTDGSNSIFMGDSGGPFVIKEDSKWYLVGVTNAVGTDNKENPTRPILPSIFASVPVYTAQIQLEASVNLITPNNSILEAGMVLDWEDYPFIDRYYYQVSTSPNFDANLVTGVETNKSFHWLLETLAPGTTYYWRVWAGRGEQTSPFSETRTFRTPAVPDISPTAQPPENDQTPPTANGYTASVNGAIVNLSVSGVADSGSGVQKVNYSAKFDNTWRGIGSSTSYPYSFVWDMCSVGVPNGDIELGMEVWDNAGNKWVWSEHYTNPRIAKNYVCTGSGTTPSDTATWQLHGWMNRFLAGYTNWEGTITWNSYPYIWADWGTGAPFSGFPNDEWSLRFWRDVYFQGGEYQFGIRSDDGARIMLDGESSDNPTMNCWYDTCDDSRVRYVSPGWHRVTVEYYEKGGDARLFAYWYGPDYPRPDQAAPTGRVTAPSDLSATGANPLVIEAEASDDASGVNYVLFWAWYCLNGTCEWHQLGSDYDAPYRFEWNWSSIPEQLVHVYVDIFDKSGKMAGTAGGWVKVYLDKTDPQTWFTKPVENARHNKTSVSLQVQTSDTNGARKAQFFARYSGVDGDYWHEIGWDTNNDDATFDLTWDSSVVPPNTALSFFAWSYDQAGNYGGASVANNIVVPPDEQVNIADALLWDSTKTRRESFTYNSEGYLVATVENIANTAVPIELKYTIFAADGSSETRSASANVEPGVWYRYVRYRMPAINGAHTLIASVTYMGRTTYALAYFTTSGAPAPTATRTPTATPASPGQPTATMKPPATATSTPMVTSTATPSSPEPGSTPTPGSPVPDSQVYLYLPNVSKQVGGVTSVSQEVTVESMPAGQPNDQTADTSKLAPALLMPSPQAFATPEPLLVNSQVSTLVATPTPAYTLQPLIHAGE